MLALFTWSDLFATPLAIVIWLSLVIGLLMVLLFAWTSDQKAIGVAKDQLKAHMLAVRLFQDQISVVMKAYGRIVRGTGRYIRLAFKPLLFVIIPITFLIVEVDRYLGWTPIETAQSFLVKVKTSNPDALNEVALKLPPELVASAPPVHVPAENEVVWRVTADKIGAFDVNVAASGQIYTKRVVVSPGISRLSLERLRAPLWQRYFSSAEPELQDGPVSSIAVTYPTRSLRFAWMDWNWIVLFFVLSMIAGFLFKEILGIEI
ncbi:MAG TPA: hypothetical protein VFA68_17440 [Terriglobales bacterium]|nr:hypothetical protein [Terriglobales bacterium]